MKTSVKIENIGEEFLPVLKSLAEVSKATLSVFDKKEKTSMEQALEEIQNGECESFKNFDEYKKAMMNV